MGAIASLSLLSKGMAREGFLLIVAANFGMEGGLVFYNSFLPRIAPEAYQGRVSAWGFMVGYAGSIVSLLIALPLVKAGDFKATWIMVAVFFALCSMPAFFFLPADARGEYSIFRAGLRGFTHAKKALREIWAGREPRKF